MRGRGSVRGSGKVRGRVSGRVRGSIHIAYYSLVISKPL